MKIKKLIAENFLSIGKIEVDFDKYNGLVLIEGINKDSHISTSNGAGKSSIYEALFWGLFGKTKRGLTGDDVINRQVGKNCFVVVYFDDYYVIRTRQHHQYKNHLMFFKGQTELTKGTIKETQEEIERILGLSDLTFSKITYFGQGDVKPFASLTDAELKEVFEQALQLDFIADKYSKANKKKNDIDTELMKTKIEVEHLERDKNNALDTLEVLQSEEQKSEQTKQERIKQLKQKIADLIKECKEAEEKLKEDNNTDNIKKQIDELTQKIADLSSWKEQKKVFEDNLKKYLSKKSEINTHTHLAKNKVKEIIDTLSNIDKQIGQVCSQCGREFTKNDIDKLSATLNISLDEHKNKLNDFEQLIAKLDSKEKEIEKALQVIQQEISDREQYILQIHKLQNQMSVSNLYEQVIQKNKIEIETCKKELENIIISKSLFKDRITEIENKIEAIKNSIATLNNKITTLEQEKIIYNAILDILGNQGLKTYIFENITPELNRKANEYISMLDDIEIEISTITKLKNGETRDKFKIDVRNMYGGDKYNGNSGGEQQKINLAISLAFNELMRQLSSNNPDILFLDEPFESLDEGSADSVIELCQHIAGNIGKVFLITHNNSLKELVTQTITVVKKNGKTTLQ